jgi:hypothetical protein
MMVTQETQGFLDRFMPPEDNSPTSCVLVLHMAIDVVVEVVDMSFRVPLPLLLYPKGRGYKEVNRVGYNIIPIRTLSLLAYFTYILIDIIIYALESTPGSSRIFWMVG